LEEVPVVSFNQEMNWVMVKVSGRLEPELPVEGAEAASVWEGWAGAESSESSESASLTGSAAVGEGAAAED
jgi:hypothetical protein